MDSELPLSAYVPVSMLRTEQHFVSRARYAAIDAHNHLGRWLSSDGDWMVADVPALLETMDACNIRAMANLDGMWGDELEANLDRYDRAYPRRFYTFAQVDWDLAGARDGGGRLARQFEESAKRGACGLKVWKNLGLRVRDAKGDLLAIDDECLDELWHAAGAHSLPVLIHIADPVAFFRPLDHTNERWEELHAHPDWHFPSPPFPPFEALLEQFERLVARHKSTVFIGAHVGCYAENLPWVSRMLETYPNFAVDIAARLAELGRQPYAAARFFRQYSSRILFGLDSFPPAVSDYAPYFRFLETSDEYFDYDNHPPGAQGRWKIYGIALEDPFLENVYFRTAERLIIHRAMPATVEQPGAGAGSGGT